MNRHKRHGKLAVKAAKHLQKLANETDSVIDVIFEGDVLTARFEPRDS